VERLRRFLSGYVQLRIDGRLPERFINLASSRGVELWDVRRQGASTLVKARWRGPRLLKHLAQASRCRVRVSSRAGVPFLARRLWRRKSVPFAVLAFFGLLYALSSLVWVVDVRGLETVDEAALLELLEEAGLRRGAPVWSIDAPALERRIVLSDRRIFWADVRFQGTRAVVEIVERVVPPPPETAFRVGDLVARRDGLVEEVLVLAGRPVVSKGDAVSAGDLLIEGVAAPELGARAQEGVESPDGAGEHRIRARGIVRARVWYEAYAEIPLVETKRIRTGREYRRTKVNAGGVEVILTGRAPVPFEQSEVDATARRYELWRNSPLAVEFITECHYEVREIERELDEEPARARALARARGSLARRIPLDARVQSERVIEDDPRPGAVGVRLIVETREDVAKFRPASEAGEAQEWGPGRSDDDS